MTGLDKIVESIEKTASTEAEQIRLGAEEEASRIINDAHARAEDKCAEIVAKARADAGLAAHISASNAAVEGKKLLLSTRQTIVSGVIDEAVARLTKLPDSEYFDVIAGLCARYADKGDGEIILSSADRARMPKGFADDVNSRLPSGSSLRVSEETRSIGGGFILRYGGIEENCTFSALALEKREALSDMLSGMLFDQK